MSLSQNSLNNGARWEVRWLGKKGRIVAKPFDEDFNAALKTYNTLRDAGKKLVTLRCCNVGFAPPERITMHEYITYEVVRRGGKRYKRKVYNTRDLMHEYNAKGIWWCPYCIQLRRFEDRSTRRQMLLVCPVCEITNYNWHVKRWNPQAKTVEFRQQRRKRGVRSRTRRG